MACKITYVLNGWPPRPSIIKVLFVNKLHVLTNLYRVFVYFYFITCTSYGDELFFYFFFILNSTATIQKCVFKCCILLR